MGKRPGVIGIFVVIAVIFAFSPLAAQPGQAFRIEALECKGLTCEIAEGWQAGLTILKRRLPVLFPVRRRCGST